MTLINNFCNTYPIRVSGNVHPTCGKLVSLIQHSSSMHLQHDMTPAQAREMAAALIAEANQLEMEL